MITAKLEIKIDIDRPDARELVGRGANAAIDVIRQSLIDGVTSDSGQPRPRKADGKPRGYNTGKLANGLTITTVSGGERVASTRVIPPADRAGWVASQGDVITGAGRVGEALQGVVDEYTEGLA